MAHRKAKVFLGFDDEAITEKYKSQVNFATNKLGGEPDWPIDGVTSPLCKLCGLPPPLLLQVYAPLENSPYHRTLYLFGCLNPNCWNQNESWICLRSQILDTTSKDQSIKTSPSSVVFNASDWCTDADEWDEDIENGNLVNPAEVNDLSDGECEHSCNTCTTSGSPDSADDVDDVFDTDGQSTGALSSHLGKMRMDGVAQRDANFNASWNKRRLDGACAILHSPQPSAEIEGDESELVSIDTPTGPQLDLHALLKESAPLPKDIRNAHFSPVFICVAEEDVIKRRDTEMSGHVRLLLAEYQQNQGQPFDSDVQGAEGGCAGGDAEKYEQSIPAHGDMLFHRFLQHIQQTPGQILRYCREGGSPLPIAPLVDIPSNCSYCQGEMMFELQVLPSIISKLKLQMQGGGDMSGSHIEFGTVLIWTCRQSCWASGDNVREERVVVQAERF